MNTTSTPPPGLTTRQLEIWYGHSGLPPEKEEAYRALWTQRRVSAVSPSSAVQVTTGCCGQSAKTGGRQSVVPITETNGPGTRLKEVLESLGLLPENCQCLERMREMNIWGLDECRRNTEVILSWLRQEQRKRGWLSQLKAAALAVTTGLAFRLDPLDPAPGLLQEALAREEARLASTR